MTSSIVHFIITTACRGRLTIAVSCNTPLVFYLFIYFLQGAGLFIHAYQLCNYGLKKNLTFLTITMVTGCLSRMSAAGFATTPTDPFFTKLLT